MMPQQSNFWNEDAEKAPENVQPNASQGFTNQIYGEPSSIPITQGYSAGFFPETSAILAVVLAALSYACFGILTAIPAVIIAKKAMDVTDNFPNHPDAGTAKAAYILGWVNIGLFVAGALFWGIIIVASLYFG